MLICNLIEERYNQIKKAQFGLCTNEDMFLSLLNQEFQSYLGCTPFVSCYPIEECTSLDITCSLTIGQTIEPLSCSLTITQNFDDL